MLLLPALEGLWSSLYSTGFGRISQFNNTLIMGSLVLSLLLLPVMLPLSNYLVVQYRQRLMTWITNHKVVEFLRGTRIYQLYQQLQG